MAPPDAPRMVVIVEDDAAMRKAIERVLWVHGIASIAFASAEAALADGRAARASCLIVDIRLPGVSGIDLCQQLARVAPLPPAIFTTAHDDARYRQAAQRTGATAYFVKPFSGRELADVVSNVLERA